MTDPKLPDSADPLPASPPHDAPDETAAAANSAYVYMIPFVFSCVVLTVVPLLGEILAAMNGGGGLDFSGLRPLALLTGSGLAFVLLMRGLAPDYQIITLVSLFISLAMAIVENMFAGQTLLLGGFQMRHSLETMSTFVQATFFSAAAAAAWLAPGDRPAHHAPPAFLRYLLAVLAIVHFLLPCDLVLQSVVGYWPNDLAQSAAHDRIRVGLWCLAAAATLLYAAQALRPQERQKGREGNPPSPP